MGGSAAAAPVSHHGDALVQVEAWPEQVYELGLDVWTHRTAVPRVLARVPPQQRAMLDASGLSYVVVEPDIGPRLDAERARLTGAAPVLGGGLDPSYFDDYRDFDTVLDRLAALAATQARVTIVEVGLSLEGRPIRGVRVTNPGGPDDRPVVMVMGAQHAREWVTVATTVYAAERFALAAGGSGLDDMLDQVELVVVPVVNPDGYVYSWDFERLWRKNRRDGIGVDLNRNWGLQWGGEGASAEPEEATYRGAGPFSEPETAAVRDFVNAEPDMLAMLDVHAFGQLVLYPWGYAEVDSVDDMLLDDLAYDMANPMWTPYEEWYAPLQSSALYPAAGNGADWAYGVHGIYAMAMEQRPTYDEPWGFVLPPDQIVPTGEELVLGITGLIETTVALGPGAPGDSGGVETEGAEGTTEGGNDESTSGSSDTGGLTTGPATETGEPPPPTSADSADSADSGVEPPPPPLPGDTGSEVLTESDGGEPGAGSGEGTGCGCRGTGDGPAPQWWLWLLPVLGSRRRRS